jgi:hypothetical protein
MTSNQRALADASRLTTWRSSTYSGASGGECLEVNDTHATAVPVRDSKNPHGPALLFTPTTWTAFLTGLTAR